MQDEATKHAIDALSVVTVIGTLTDVLPPLAALATLIWTTIRILETDTVRGLLGKNKNDRSD